MPSAAKLHSQQQLHVQPQLQETLVPYENHSVFAFSRAICQGGRPLTTFDKLEPVLALLPNINKRGAEGRPLSKLQEGTVVGIAGFLIESKGLFLDKIWPSISVWLCCSVLKPQREAFVAALFTQFARVALLIRSCRNELTDAFISILEGKRIPFFLLWIPFFLFFSFLFFSFLFFSFLSFPFLSHLFFRNCP